MMEILWLVGAVGGACVGCIHAVDIYRRCHRGTVSGTLGGRARALYYGAWTLVLWVLFGAYVLVVGLLGVILYAAAGRPPPPTAATSRGDVP